jgi:hypothetical protein
LAFYWVVGMSPAIRWVCFAIGVVVLAAGVYVVLRSGNPKISQPAPLDPTRTIVDVQIPVVEVHSDRQKAFVVPNDIVVHPRAIVRVRGKFRTGQRNGTALVIAEAKVPSGNGSMAVYNNGSRGVRMSPNTESEFEVLMYQPQLVRDCTLEIRLGDEFLATGQLKAGR